MNFKNRLDTVAKYLGKQGLYKEASQIQKLASTMQNKNFKKEAAAVEMALLGAMPAALLVRNLAYWYESPGGKEMILNWKKQFGLTDEEGEALAREKIQEYRERLQAAQIGRDKEGRAVMPGSDPTPGPGLGLFEIGKSSSRKNTLSKLAMEPEEAQECEEALEEIIENQLAQIASAAGY